MDSRWNEDQASRVESDELAADCHRLAAVEPHLRCT